MTRPLYRRLTAIPMTAGVVATVLGAPIGGAIFMVAGWAMLILLDASEDPEEVRSDVVH